MNVKLVNSTPNPEFFISYIARVSSPDNQENPDYAKLIKYLLKNKHFSPFEHSYFTFQIVTSRALTAQILRHRSLTFQELSQRYAVVDEIEPIELRRQAVKNRQSSEEIFDPYIEREFIGDSYASYWVDQHNRDSLELYKQLIDAGVAKECARMILPMATQTTLYATGSVRSWIHYLNLRNDEHTQKEHQLIAQEIENILRLYVPTVFEALDTLKAEGWTM
jgi:thymidylate synthase (FAD)